MAGVVREVSVLDILGSSWTSQYALNGTLQYVLKSTSSPVTMVRGLRQREMPSLCGNMLIHAAYFLTMSLFIIIGNRLNGTP